MEYPHGKEMLWNPRSDHIKNWPVRICGIAAVGTAMLGVTFIVELLNPIPGYKYTHAAAFERDLTEIPEVKTEWYLALQDTEKAELAHTWQLEPGHGIGVPRQKRKGKSK